MVFKYHKIHKTFKSGHRTIIVECLTFRSPVIDMVICHSIVKRPELSEGCLGKGLGVFFGYKGDLML